MGHHPCCCGCNIVNGSFTPDLSGWTIVGNVEHDPSPSNMESYAGDTALVCSYDGGAVLAETIANIRTALNGGGYGGWGGLLTGDTDPLPLFFNDGVGYETTSGLSVCGAVMYQEFSGVGGDDVVFDWSWHSTQRTAGNPPSPDYIDYCFVALQRLGGSPVVERLADACTADNGNLGPTNAPFTPFNSYSTSVATKTITLPGSGAGTYRLIFGCINVNVQNGASALVVSDVGCA